MIKDSGRLSEGIVRGMMHKRLQALPPLTTRKSFLNILFNSIKLIFFINNLLL